MELKLLPIPATAPPWAVREAKALRNRMKAQTFWNGGVLFWNSSQRPVPPSCFADAFVKLPSGQQAKHDEHQTAAISAYKLAQAARTPEMIAEEQMMARAAMGEGVEMVNILTGETFRT